MAKLTAQVLPIIITLLAIACLSCDDYNIVEPRFYSEDEIAEIPNCYRSVACPGDGDTTVGDVARKIIPSNFDLEACWINRAAGELAVWYSLPMMSHVKVCILRSSGVVDVVQADRVEQAGTYLFFWSAEENGVYGMSMQSGKYEETIWFEVEMAVE